MLISHLSISDGVRRGPERRLPDQPPRERERGARVHAALQQVRVVGPALGRPLPLRPGKCIKISLP